MKTKEKLKKSVHYRKTTNGQDARDTEKRDSEKR